MSIMAIARASKAVAKIANKIHTPILMKTTGAEIPNIVSMPSVETAPLIGKLSIKEEAVDDSTAVSDAPVGRVCT